MFKIIPGVETEFKTYEASSDGKIIQSIDKKTGKVYELSQWNDRGYINVSTPTGITTRLHILVALAHIKKPLEADDTWTVDHIDKKTVNNDVSNLRWASQKTQKTNRDKTERTKIDSHPVVGIHIKSGHIVKFESTYAAEILPNVDRSSISKCIRGDRLKMHAGYTWTTPLSDPDIPGELWKSFHINKKYEVLFSQFGRIAYAYHHGYTKKITARQKNSDRQNAQDEYPRFRKNNINYSFHRIVTELFDQEIANGLVVHHKNNDKQDASLSNLEITTQSLNCIYSHDDGRYFGTKSERVPVIIDENEFISIEEAVEKMNIPSTTIKFRLNSSKFSNYMRK
jgi:hypothetical protein